MPTCIRNAQETEARGSPLGGQLGLLSQGQSGLYIETLPHRVKTNNNNKKTTILFLKFEGFL
jgi:hypothetical protein